MSKESIEQLFQAANEDLTLQQKLENANGYAEAVQIGAENGYEFTEQEAEAFLVERGIVGGPEGELSEEALEAVAGGWFDNNRIRIGGW
jgi:predicted ribosomally synthesized peptide with nif11-like leader